ncbi:hypothetical protein [Streptomyces sp. McG3]|uniref:hypothetical protein n=1 Tax=unclassified Streptomyces TaxID=2593676 RepID=UPI001BE72F74|nr:hypothetical protein [Streptomyces sp. McG3]MBT2896990.1 hypothetical protein [Streptomyces sp. McG3]
MPQPTGTSRRMWSAAWAVLCAAGLAATAGPRTSSEPEPESTPTRVYSSCLAADTKATAGDNDPCAGG